MLPHPASAPARDAPVSRAEVRDRWHEDLLGDRLELKISHNCLVRTGRRGNGQGTEVELMPLLVALLMALGFCRGLLHACDCKILDPKSRTCMELMAVDGVAPLGFLTEGRPSGPRGVATCLTSHY